MRLNGPVVRKSKESVLELVAGLYSFMCFSWPERATCVGVE